MTPLIPALAGALMVAGLIGVVVGLRRTPGTAAAPDADRATGTPAGRSAGGPGSCCWPGCWSGWWSRC